MFLCDFTKCNGEQPSDKGTNICNRIKLTLEYEESENYLRNKAVRGGSKFDHGADKFIGEFNTIYQENNDIFNGLLCFLMHIFVEYFGCKSKTTVCNHCIEFITCFGINWYQKIYEFVAEIWA